MPIRKDPRLNKTSTANSKILDNTIRHQHYIESYKTHVSNDAVRLLNTKVLPDLVNKIQLRLDNIKTRGFDTSPATTTRLRQMVAANAEIIKAGMKKVNQQVQDELNRFAKVESQWSIFSLKNSVPFAIDFLSPSPATLEAILTSNPMQGHLLSDWFDSLAARTQQKVTQQINIGLTQGESVDDMVRRLRGTKANNFSDGILDATRRDIESVVRTATNHVSTHAREATYDENSDVVDKIQLVATLDARTTLICMKHDGETYPVNEGPRPPFHFNCRTTTVPVLKSWKDLGIDLKEAPASTRASMNGQVADDVTYGDWLKSQPASIQDEALGPRRAELFRSGDVKIDQFVTDKSRTLTLPELAKKYDITP